jgi:hypothetical protein
MPRPNPLFTFAVIADSHLNPEGKQNTSPWRTNRLANSRNELVVQQLNQLQPTFIVHLGDVTHPVPAHPDYLPATDAAKKLFQPLTRPLYFVPGNHDVGDKPLDWMPADCISENAVLIFRKIFGPDWGSFNHGDCHFIWINSSLLNSRLPFECEQKQWLEADLGEVSGKRVFLFTHYPPYLCRADEGSHYDNLDEPARSWLCELVVKHRIEALFAGHVHNFFYNRLGATDCYVLPSVTNLRQDYAELFRVEPADEYGRNDIGKLGFFLVDVYRDRHVAHFVHTKGAQFGGAQLRSQAQTFRRAELSRIGVDLRHPWAEEIELPYNAPLDELGRKRVRNDYGLLALRGLGIINLRAPFSDLADDRVRQRMVDLHALGNRFAVFTFGVPDDAVLRLMSNHRAIIERWELVLPTQAVEAACARLKRARKQELPSIWFTKLRSHDEGKHDQSKPFDHSVSLGLDASEHEELAQLSVAHDRHSAIFDGVIFKIEFDQVLMPAVQHIIKLSETFGIRAAICVKLAPARSAASSSTIHDIANRVAEVILCAWCNPNIEFFLDTFQDIDRGYFLRRGLIDRRCNPQLAGDVFRELHLMFEELQPQEVLYDTAAEVGRSIEFQARDSQGVLWLPKKAQCGGAKLGNAQPVILPDGAEVDISGPWIEITRSHAER